MVGCSSVLLYVSPYYRMDNNGLGYTKQYVNGIVKNEFFFKVMTYTKEYHTCNPAFQFPLFHFGDLTLIVHPSF